MTFRTFRDERGLSAFMRSKQVCRAALSAALTVLMIGSTTYAVRLKPGDIVGFGEIDTQVWFGAQVSQQPVMPVPPARPSRATPLSWEHTFGGKLNDIASAVQVTADGGYIVAGTNYSKRIGLGGDAWVLKLDAQGQPEWDRTFGGEEDDRVFAVQATADGGYIVAGDTYSKGAGHYDVWVLKLDAQGEQKWERTFGGKNMDRAFAVQVTADGGYLVVGYTGSKGAGWRPDTDNPFPHLTAWVLKLDAQGRLEWDHTLGRKKNYNSSRVQDERAFAVQATADGGYIVAGDTEFNSPGFHDAWVLKLDAQGKLEWERTFGGKLNDSAHAVQATADGGYIVVGDTRSKGAGESDAWVLKLDRDGRIEEDAPKNTR